MFLPLLWPSVHLPLPLITPLHPLVGLIPSPWSPFYKPFSLPLLAACSSLPPESCPPLLQALLEYLHRPLLFCFCSVLYTVCSLKEISVFHLSHSGLCTESTALFPVSARCLKPAMATTGMGGGLHVCSSAAASASPPWGMGNKEQLGAPRRQRKIISESQVLNPQRL